MRNRALVAGVLGALVFAGFFVMCGDDSAARADDETTLANSPRPGLGSPTPGVEKRPEPRGDETEEEVAVVRGSTGFDAGPLDGGSFDEFVGTVGKQAVLQFLADNAAAAEKNVERYCAETKDLVNRKELADPPRKRDAAHFMSGRSDWEGGTIGLLHLPASLTQRMGNPPMAWRTAGPDLYAGLDFTWMTELQQFDYWSLLGSGPLRDTREEPVFYEENLPNYVTLQSWAKLRLLKGVHEGKLGQASVEVRHLAELIATSGTLVGEMIRLSLYAIERKTWEDLGQPMPEGLPSSDEAWRLRHAAFAGLYLMHPGVPRAVKEKALKCIPMRCAGLLEAIGAAAALRQVVPGMQEEIDWLQAQSPCDTELAARLARSPPATSELLARSYTSEQSLVSSMQSLTDGGL